LPYGLEDLDHSWCVPDDADVGEGLARGRLRFDRSGLSPPSNRDLACDLTHRVQVEWLDQEVHGPVPHRGRNRRKILIRRHENHRAIRVPLPQEPKQLEAGHARHADVDERDVRIYLGQHLERFFRAGSGCHGRGRAAECIGERAPDSLVVVDDQEGARHCRLAPAGRRGWVRIPLAKSKVRARCAMVAQHQETGPV
jgi:hypothetical protein